MLGGNRGRRTQALCALVAVAAIAAAGCGGDDEDGSADAKPKFSAASEPSKTFIERMAKLLETTTEKKDCPLLEQINQRSFTRFPCPPPKELRQSMARFDVVETEVYGTGAVVDYKSGTAKDGAAVVMFVAPDREWGISRFGIITEPSVGTSDADSRDGYAKAVDDYLAAVRDRDCKAFVKVAFTNGADAKTACRTSFKGTEDLAKRLKANPSVKPKYEGGNSSYGFFTLETKKPKPENLTISVIKSTTESAAPYVVLDAAPSPTAAEQRQVIEQFKKQQRQKKPPNQPETSPSRKADPPPVRTS
ncbi:MAG TPA: hypothetical protein VHF90_08895 [Thermoleophilaceae bacterium]|nr:hypothetical protein [Thermoleophilaceae bacterium]